jgi:hypothetical protein
MLRRLRRSIDADAIGSRLCPSTRLNEIEGT